MSTVTQEIAGQIDERVDEIQAEIRKLEQARAALTGVIAERKTARPRTRDHAPTSKRTVARRKVLEQIGEGRRNKLKTLNYPGGPVPTRPSNNRKKGRGKVSPGTRPRQVLDLIKANPGITTSGLATGIAGVNGPHVYQIVNRFAEAGEIAGSHKGWRLKD